MSIEVVPMEPAHRDWVSGLMTQHFGSDRVLSLGVLHDTRHLPGLVALRDTRPIGFLHAAVTEDTCEIVALVSEVQRIGVARTLINALSSRCASQGVRRVRLVTTNDNLGAQAFCRACGFQHTRTHVGAVDQARALKPEIPRLGDLGIPISDELEFEKILLGSA